MVLLAAAVCTKAGKAIISRQFVEMTRSRIEGLLSAFPKLMSSGKQHTFVETESVRYVYQPLDKLYVILITTKASNILEDLETLRLFSRVIPEYCRTLEESDILDNAFNLIFAFDEIVALGYRESVNLAQIRTFVEMDSHEEKVYQAVRQTQEREAKQKMREKAKELQRQRYEAQKRGVKSHGFGGSGGFGSNSGYTPTPTIGDSASTMHETPKISYSAPTKASSSSKAMKLGGKTRDVDSFVDQLKSEGVAVTSNNAKLAKSSAVAKISTPIQNMELVHLRFEEKMNVTAGRDGGLQNMEVHGLITLRIGAEEYSRIKVQLDNADTRGIQLQTHPQVDKDLFKQIALIGLKNSVKSFPLNTEVGVLKWRYQTQEDSNIPLSINCWPSENGQGGCDVNIEYQLEEAEMELNDVVITIPLMPGGGTPIVTDCDGDYTHEPRKNILLWQLPVIDAANRSGTLEFSVSGNPDDFFPVTVSFHSTKSYANLRIADVMFVDDDSPVKHSLETVLYTEKYEIV